jgi:predicted CXXCH cytochrome family protein
MDADRLGDEPSTAVDPSNPPSPASLMAQEIANVVARDLPVGPSWLLDRSPALDPTKDGAWCGGCHQPEYQAWSESVHSRSAVDPMMLFCAGVETGLKGPQFSRHCAGCHDPVSARLGDTSLTSKRGVTCLGCHDVVRTIRAGGNADLEAASHDWTQDHKAWATASLTLLTDPKFCGGCHQQFVPGTGLKPSFATLNEWEGSSYAGTPETRCVDCHMQKTASGPFDHRFVGGNLYMGTQIGAQDLIQDQTKNLQSFASLTASWNGQSIAVQVKNRGSGHDFPTGVSDIREAWVEVQALDGQKNLLARIGGPGQDGLLPQGAARLGTDLASSNGTVLLNHELSVATSVPFDSRVAPQRLLEVNVSMPSTLPAGTAELDAVLFYRNLRTTYYRAVLANPTALPPETELARVAIQ